LKLGLHALLGLAILAGASSRAMAAPSFIIDYSPANGSTGNTGASAQVGVSFSDIGGNVVMTMSVANTTNGSAGQGATQATLTGLGFALPSGAGVIGYSGGVFPNFVTGGGVPPYGAFDLCITVATAPDCVPASPSGGLAPGEQTIIEITIDTPLTADELADAIRSDYVDPTNDGSTPDTVAIFDNVNAPPGSDVVVGSIPEPAALAMLGAALAGLARARRRTARSS
jgi:hypothetical protein